MPEAQPSVAVVSHRAPGGLQDLSHQTGMPSQVCELLVGLAQECRQGQGGLVHSLARSALAVTLLPALGRARLLCWMVQPIGRHDRYS